ncbi:MAG TPA: hypothetical protein VGE26_12035 [Sphingobacteriaceae bacterium]
MKDFDALKDIWSNQVELARINADDILKLVRQSKRRLSAKLLFEVIAMAVAVLLLVYTWFTIDFRMWTSHAALIIFIVCCVYVVFAQLRDYRRLMDNSLLLDKPNEYIDYLKSYKKHRYVLNTKKYRSYTLFFIAGFAFFFIEIFFVASLWVTILGISFTVAWFLFCYFILMKSYIRKEEQRLNEMIENLERLQKQFSEDESR